jgi:hypothetical protein
VLAGRRGGAAVQRRCQEKEKAAGFPLASKPPPFKGVEPGAYTESLSFLPGLNFTTFLALILIKAPVWGLRPLRALRRAF